MTDPNVTPLVRKEAQRLGVPLASVTGTGAGGRIRVSDVQAAAGVRPAVTQAVHPAEPARRSLNSTRTSLFNSSQVTVDLYGRSPLVDDLRQANPTAYAMATREASAPTLFANGGDLPPFTASGVDPQVLNSLPWFARHDAAAAPDRGTVLAMLQNAEDDPEGALYQPQSDGVYDYQARVQAWAMGRPAA